MLYYSSAGLLYCFFIINYKHIKGNHFCPVKIGELYEKEHEHRKKNPDVPVAGKNV